MHAKKEMQKNACTTLEEHGGLLYKSSSSLQLNKGNLFFFFFVSVSTCVFFFGCRYIRLTRFGFGFGICNFQVTRLTFLTHCLTNFPCYLFQIYDTCILGSYLNQLSTSYGWNSCPSLTPHPSRLTPTVFLLCNFIFIIIYLNIILFLAFELKYIFGHEIRFKFLFDL